MCAGISPKGVALESFSSSDQTTMATSSVSLVSLTDSLAALQARMERASASLAVELTPEQVERMCEEYGKVLDDVQKGRQIRNKLTRWQSLEAKYTDQGRGRHSADRKVQKLQNELADVRARLNGRLGTGDPDQLFRRAVELEKGPLDHVVGSDECKRFALKGGFFEYAAVIPKTCEFSMKMHPRVGVAALGEIVSRYCQETLEGYARVSKVCLSKPVVEHGLKGLRDAALREAEAESEAEAAQSDEKKAHKARVALATRLMAQAYSADDKTTRFIPVVEDRKRVKELTQIYEAFFRPSPELVKATYEMLCVHFAGDSAEALACMHALASRMEQAAEAGRQEASGTSGSSGAQGASGGGGYYTMPSVPTEDDEEEEALEDEEEEDEEALEDEEEEAPEEAAAPAGDEEAEEAEQRPAKRARPV